MKEIHPGIFEATLDDVQNTEIVGSESVHDYGEGIQINGVSTLLTEISKHSEFKTRAVAIAVFNDSGVLLKVFWYSGQQLFPKEYLELAVDKHNVVIVLANMQEPSLETAKNLIEVFLPVNENTNLDYNVLDYLWSNETHGSSLLCQDTSCCSKEGQPIEGILNT